MILTEMVHDARIVRMNAKHLPPSIRKWLGDSIGHWEGDTLVVDTTNFTDKTRFRGSSPGPARRRAVHPRRREDAAVSVHDRGSQDVDQAVDRRIHLAGHRPSGCTNTRATKATTRWATSCAARG